MTDDEEFRCDYVFGEGDGEPNRIGQQCGRRLNSMKALKTHRKSHRGLGRPCRHCGQMYSNNGHTQHEASCDQQPDALPWAVWEDLLADLVAHASEIPDGTVCLVSASRGAVFMRPAAALTTAANMLTDEATLLVPTTLLQAPEVAERWRRRGPRDPIDEPPPAPAQGTAARRRTTAALFGANWDNIH